MYFCNICDYTSTVKHNYNNHLKTKKHVTKELNIINNIMKNEKKKEIAKKNFEINILKLKPPSKNIYTCFNCNKQYIHRSGLSRHYKICIDDNGVPVFNQLDPKSHLQSNYQNNVDLLSTIPSSIDSRLYKLESELSKMKLEKDMLEKGLFQKDYEHKLEIQKLKNKLSKKDFEKKLIDEKNNLLLQINNNTHITNNTNNTLINNNVKISKIQYLNLNFGNVIDINTFLKNYNDNYGLTSDQTRVLLENFDNDGINACINGIIHYLKKSAVKQYKELKGQDIDMNNIILPFLLSDKCVRDHFEKSSDNNWDKTTMIDNIQKILSITNNQIYKHHNRYMNFNIKQKKRIINGLLKQSCYNMISNITIPDFYKIKTDNVLVNFNDQKEKENDNDNDNDIKLGINNDTINCIDDDDGEVEENDEDETEYEEL